MNTYFKQFLQTKTGFGPVDFIYGIGLGTINSIEAERKEKAERWMPKSEKQTVVKTEKQTVVKTEKQTTTKTNNNQQNQIIDPEFIEQMVKEFGEAFREYADQQMKCYEAFQQQLKQNEESVNGTDSSNIDTSNVVYEYTYEPIHSETFIFDEEDTDVEEFVTIEDSDEEIEVIEAEIVSEEEQINQFVESLENNNEPKERKQRTNKKSNKKQTSKKRK